VGVGLGWDPRAASEYLFDEALGPWNEIHAGGNWLNELVVDRIWRATDAPGYGPIASFPQVLILVRDLAVRDDAITFGPDRVLRRFVGIRALEAWASDGHPLPPLGQDT
jgi:hypothetical protein